MSSIKVLLYKSNKKSDGTYPIALRVIQNRKPIYYQLGHSIKESDWDNENQVVKKSYPNSARLNHLILTKKTELSEILLSAQQEDRELPNKTVIKRLNTKNRLSFQTLADEHLSDLLKLKKFNQHSGEKPRVNHFVQFLENSDESPYLTFQNISVQLLKKYIIYLKSDKKLGERSIVNCLIVIRTLFNKAISNGLVEHKYYPFGKGKIQLKFPESMKMGLNEKEIKTFENFELEKDSREWHARNVWLTSFYMAGIRISDVIQLKWRDINDNRLTYRMDKNKKIVSLKLPSKVLDIISYYQKDKKNNIYIFPYLKNENEFDINKLHSRVRSVNSLVNKYNNKTGKSAEITKKLSMHISRHSFGNIAGNKIPPQALQKLYRHSDIKTTIGYQANFIHQDVDDALDSVINF
jgi:integrase/recombinase XerD